MINMSGGIFSFWYQKLNTQNWEEEASNMYFTPPINQDIEEGLPSLFQIKSNMNMRLKIKKADM